MKLSTKFAAFIAIAAIAVPCAAQAHAPAVWPKANTCVPNKAAGSLRCTITGKVTSVGQLSMSVLSGSLTNTFAGAVPLSDLTVGAAGKLAFTLDPAAAGGAAATRYVVSGAANLASGSQIDIRFASKLTTGATFNLIHSPSLTNGGLVSDLLGDTRLHLGEERPGEHQHVDVPGGRGHQLQPGLARHGRAGREHLEQFGARCLGTCGERGGPEIRLVHAEALRGGPPVLAVREAVGADPPFDTLGVYPDARGEVFDADPGTQQGGTKPVVHTEHSPASCGTFQYPSGTFRRPETSRGRPGTRCQRPGVRAQLGI